jgi:hypothetical protein
MLSGDDELSVEGQKAIALLAEKFPATTTYFGDAAYLQPNGAPRISRRVSRGWKGADKSKGSELIIRRQFPNINGTWYPTETFREAVTFSINLMGDFNSFAGDVAVWWHAHEHSSFQFVPTTSVLYRDFVTQSKSKHYMKGRTAYGQLKAMSMFYHYISKVSEKGSLTDRKKIENSISKSTNHLCHYFLGLTKEQKAEVWDEFNALKLNIGTRLKLRLALHSKFAFRWYVRFLNAANRGLHNFSGTDGNRP